MLTPAETNGADAAAKDGGEAAAAARLVLPAVFSGGQLYVFDAGLGLPLRPRMAVSRRLNSSARTTACCARYDLPDMAYPLSAEKLPRVTINVVADQFDLSRTAFQLERKLTGENRVVLTTNATDVAGRMKALSGVGEVRIGMCRSRLSRPIKSPWTGTPGESAGLRAICLAAKSMESSHAALPGSAAAGR